jgi:hypothetical protein
MKRHAHPSGRDLDREASRQPDQPTSTAEECPIKVGSTPPIAGPNRVRREGPITGKAAPRAWRETPISW